jgi:hypothetical protein
MNILDKIISAESSGDPNAGAATSSAVGLGQFTKKTWLDLIKHYRPDLMQGKSRDEILAMRTDPDLSRQMVGALVGEDTAAFRRAGVPVTEGTTYLAQARGNRARPRPSDEDRVRARNDRADRDLPRSQSMAREDGGVRPADPVCGRGRMGQSQGAAQCKADTGFLP